MLINRPTRRYLFVISLLVALQVSAGAFSDVIFNDSFEGFVQDEPGTTSVFYWRMNEASGTTYADFGPNNQPMFSDGSPNHTDPEFGPYSAVRDPNGDAAKTAIFAISDVTWPADKIWIHWWMRPQTGLDWRGGTNQDMVRLYAKVYSPPRIWRIQKNGTVIDYRFFYQGGSTGWHSFDLSSYDPTTFHLFSVYYDGTNGNYGVWVDTDHVQDLNTGTTGVLNFGASDTEGLIIRTRQNDCLMFDLHIKSETPTREKIQALYRRYTNS